MQVSIINFSSRRRGNGDIVTRLLARACMAAGSEVRILQAREHPLQSCTGCMRCIFRHPGTCILEDDLPQYIEALQAEKLFLVSPVYFLTPVSAWKALQDRMLVFQPHLPETTGHCGVVITAGLPGWSVADPLLAVLGLSTGHRISTIETVYGPGPGEVILDPANLERIDAVARQVLNGELRSRPGCCAVCFQPVMRREGNWYCPVCDVRWRQDDGPDYEESRWHPRRLATHYHDWVFASGEAFRRSLPDLRRRLKELDLEG